MTVRLTTFIRVLTCRIEGQPPLDLDTRQERHR